MSRNRFGEWALVQIKNRTLTPSATLMAGMLIDLVREGSLKDDKKYGYRGNKPLNFLRKPRSGDDAAEAPRNSVRARATPAAG